MRTLCIKHSLFTHKCDRDPKVEGTLASSGNVMGTGSWKERDGKTTIEKVICRHFRFIIRACL